MLFKVRFKVIEIHEGGVKITHYLEGKKKDVMKDVETFKNNCKDYEMIGKEGMIVWV